MSPFEAARKLLSPDCDSLSLGDQLDLVFQDMDLVPLLVQVRGCHDSQACEVAGDLDAWVLDPGIPGHGPGTVGCAVGGLRFEAWRCFGARPFPSRAGPGAYCWC